MTDTAPRPAATDGDRGDGAPPPRPAPRLPLIPTPLEAAVAAWRRLRRMSTALWLLFALATATLVATFVPQDPVIGSTVTLWREGVEGPGAATARVLDALSLFDVFGSWWFAVLTALLFTSLTGCLVPRWRAFARGVRRPPARGTNLARLTHRVALPRPAGTPEEVLDRVAPVFRTHRTLRTTAPSGAPQLAIERGHWREGGSLLFHTSFYLLLVGVILGSASSFTGQIDVVEGGTFADTPLGYQTSSAGRLWSTDDHGGHLTTIEDFTVTYLEGDDRFVPDEFVTRLRFTPADGGQPVTAETRVNHPAHHDGLTYYQRAFGFAPQITLRSGLDGTELYDKPLILRDDGGLWVGRDKVSLGSADPDRPLPQIAIEVVLVPDGSFDEQGRVRFNSPEARDPRLLVSLYADEDLGLARAVPVSQLDFPQRALVDQVMVRPGESVPLAPVGAEGALFELAFTDLPMWTGLQVSHQPFRWVLLTAASLVLAGLLPSLYAYRRRLWVEVHDDHVLLAGVALQRRDRFETAFADLADRVRERLGDPDRTPASTPPLRPTEPA
jgi:cytochrome c biogenesis protein